MRKNKTIITVFLAFAMLICGCYPPAYGGRYMDAYTVAAYSVVGADDVKEMKVIDKDQYGRKLVYLKIGNPVFYSYYSNRTPETMCSHVFLISQETKDNKVYYYEDVCFRVYEKESDFTTFKRNELEIENDWGQPLNEEKMTYRNTIKRGGAKFEGTGIDIFGGTDCNDPWLAFYLAYYKRDTIEPQDKRHMVPDLLDADRNQNLLWVVHQYEENNDGGVDIDGYFMLTKPDWKETKAGAVKKIEDIDTYWEELAIFKQVNDWQPW